MNHDYAHCLDYSPDCPKNCFRAELTKDLKKRIDLLGLPFAWSHFKGTEECKKKEKKKMDVYDAIERAERLLDKDDVSYLSNLLPDEAEAIRICIEAAKQVAGV